MVEKINYVKRKRTKLQTIWNYMRRNPNFRSSEILIVCTVSMQYLIRYLNALEEARYIKLNTTKNTYSNREYTLINNTGVIAPKIIKHKEIYDENIKETYQLNYQDLKLIPGINQVLQFVKESNFATKRELCFGCEIKEKELEFILQKLKEVKVLVDSFNECGIKNYIFDSRKASRVIRKLK